LETFAALPVYKVGFYVYFISGYKYGVYMNPASENAKYEIVIPVVKRE